MTPRAYTRHGTWPAQQGQGQLLQSLESGIYPMLLPPTDLGVGRRSHCLTQTQETTSNRFAQLLLAMSKLWKCFEDSGAWLHPIHTGSGSGSSSARYVARQRRTYNIAQPRIKGNGLSLNAALKPKPLSFRALTASMIAQNERGSHTFSPLVLVGMTEDQSCTRHKTWLQRALSLHRSLHYYAVPQRKTQFRTQTFEPLKALKG